VTSGRDIARHPLKSVTKLWEGARGRAGSEFSCLPYFVAQGARQACREVLWACTCFPVAGSWDGVTCVLAQSGVSHVSQIMPVLCSHWVPKTLALNLMPPVPMLACFRATCLLVPVRCQPCVPALCCLGFHWAPRTLLCFSFLCVPPDPPALAHLP
jgi:hypothetical protein